MIKKRITIIIARRKSNKRAMNKLRKQLEIMPKHFPKFIEAERKFQSLHWPIVPNVQGKVSASSENKKEHTHFSSCSEEDDEEEPLTCDV
jgi:hypothetical protein